MDTDTQNKDLTKELSDVLHGNIGESVKKLMDQNSRIFYTENNIAKLRGRT